MNVMAVFLLGVWLPAKIMFLFPYLLKYVISYCSTLLVYLYHYVYIAERKGNSW